MVNSVTNPWLAQWGVIGEAGGLAMRQTLSVRLMPPRWRMSGCTMSTARMSIMCFQVAISQSCSPPVTATPERVGDSPGLLELPVEAGLLEMLDAVVLEHPADLDRPFGRKAAVGVDQQGNIAERLADGGHDLLRPARPFVHVVPVLGGDAELEGIEAEPDRAGAGDLLRLWRPA